MALSTTLDRLEITMGTWGPGNFDSDSANDYIDEFSHQLVDKIEECFAAEDSCSLEEEGDGVIMPTVEILSVLCEHCNGLPPKPRVVAKWKRKFLAIYDEEIDSLEPTPEHKIARRRVIEETFTKLDKQAKAFAKIVNEIAAHRSEATE